MTAADITGIIAQVTTSIVAIIAALAAYKAGAKVDELRTATEAVAQSTDQKLGTIQETFTNGGVASMKADIKEMQAMLAKLVQEKKDGPTR